jgi:sulfur carrier protein ThiS
MLTVKIGQIPGRITEYALDDGTSVSAALNQAGLDTTGFGVRLNGQQVENLTSTILKDGDTVILAQKVKSASK